LWGGVCLGEKYFLAYTKGIMNNLRILSIDPSGTGTTGIFFKGDWEQFGQFTGQD